MLVVGIFEEKDDLEGLSKMNGLLKGGGTKLLLIQLLSVVCIIGWTILTSFIEVSERKYSNVNALWKI